MNIRFDREDGCNNDINDDNIGMMRTTVMMMIIALIILIITMMIVWIVVVILENKITDIFAFEVLFSHLNAHSSSTL